MNVTAKNSLTDNNFQFIAKESMSRILIFITAKITLVSEDYVTFEAHKTILAYESAGNFIV